MKKFLFPLAIPMSMLFLLMACNDPTVIGAELLEQDEADVRFTDTVTLQTKTIREDSVVTYTIDNQYNSFACGYFQDPVFGTIKSEIYSQFKEASLDPPAFENPILDSLVLTLGIDTTKVYGTFNENYRIEVSRIIEDLDNSLRFYSNESFSTDPNILGAVEFLPNPTALKPYVSVLGLDTIQGNFISVRLEDQLGMDMLNEAWYEENVFIEMLKGLQIRLANSTPTDGMLSFNMNSTFSRLRLYYKNVTADLDTIPVIYDFAVAGSTTPRHANMEHDFTGAIIEPYLNSTDSSDDLVFLQGMSGPNVSIDIPYFNDLGNIIVNKAELDFFVAELPEDDIEVYTPSNLLVVTFQEDGATEYFLADDVVLSPTAFGGNIQEEDVNGQTVKKYTMNIASYLNRRILEGNTGAVRIFLRAFPKQETINRVTLYGPSHAQYPAKLKLTYTNISN